MACSYMWLDRRIGAVVNGSRGSTVLLVLRRAELGIVVVDFRRSCMELSTAFRRVLFEWRGNLASS
jgi:hypothetical protein